MKLLEILSRLSFSWLLPTFLNTPPSHQSESLSLILEQNGQINCLEHKFHDLDILRRHEAAIFVYPEIRVGCETLSVKPFQRPLEPPPKPDDMWIYRDENYNKKRPARPDELEEKVQKYFVIDMNGKETQIHPGSRVTLETYDFSKVKFKAYEEAVFPSRILTKLQTFRFDQLCFPVGCYEPGEKAAEECVSVSQWLSAEEAGSITHACLRDPNPKKCDTNIMGKSVSHRLGLSGKSGSTLAPNITTYCSLETSDGPRLGPLKTSDFPGLHALISSRSEVPSDIYDDLDDQGILKSNLRTSVLKSRHVRTSVYKDQIFFTSCIVTVPVEPPYNISFAVDFFVAANRYTPGEPIRPGKRFKVDVKIKEALTPDGSSFKYKDAAIRFSFENLCFPDECYQERTPREAATCQRQEAKTRKHQVPGAVLFYEDASGGVNKLLWPTASYYNKFTL